MSRFKFLTNWIQKIKESDNHLFDKIIEEHKETIRDRNELLDVYEEQILELNAELLEKENTNLMLSIELDKVSSEAKELGLIDYFRPVSQWYKWDSGKTDRLHKSLNNFSQDTEYLNKYTEFNKSIGVRTYDKPDRCIYYAVKNCHKFYANKYKREQVEDYLTPQEAYDKLVTDKGADDCDGWRALLWGSIVTALINSGFKEELWRLKAVDIGIVGSEGHAIITWLDEEGNWLPIETTYGVEFWERNWLEKKDIFKSTYIYIRHIFDEFSEYKPQF